MYEIGDPKNYITPDCIADFTTIQLRDAAVNRVEVSGVKGKPATEFYKVSMSYFDGYTAFGTLTYAWPDALEKASKADEILRIRLSDLHLKFDEIRTEFLGYDSCFGPLSKKIANDERGGDESGCTEPGQRSGRPVFKRNCAVDSYRSASGDRFCGGKAEAERSDRVLAGVDSEVGGNSKSHCGRALNYSAYSNRARPVGGQGRYGKRRSDSPETGILSSP